MVAADSDRIPRVPPYSGATLAYPSLPVRACHPLRTDFPDGSGSLDMRVRVVLQPRAVRKQHGLGSSHFDRHYSGNRSFFLLLQVLRCFSSLRSPHPCGWFRAFNPEGCPIRTCADQVLFADPRAFSQLTTSFIASGSLGIPRSLLLTYSSVIKVTIDSLSLSFLFVAYEIVVPTKKTMFVFLLKLINLLLFLVSFRRLLRSTSSIARSQPQGCSLTISSFHLHTTENKLRYFLYLVIFLSIFKELSFRMARKGLQRYILF